MFDPTAFTKAGVAAERRAAAAFYKGFGALGRDSDLREACGDDHTVALGALSLTRDLLTGAMTLSPEHIQSGAFRDMARQRGLDEIAERTELQDLEEARKPAPKRRDCEVILATEPDPELASYMQKEGFRRVGNSDEHPIAFEGLACAKFLKAHLRPEDRIVFRTIVTGTRHEGDEGEAPTHAKVEREDNALPPGVAPYVIATVDAPEGLKLQDASTEELCEMIVSIVRIEAPLNQPVLQQRLRRSFGLGSIRAAHKEQIEKAIYLAVSQEHLRRTEDGFFLLAATDYVVPRFRMGKDEDVRATSNVSRMEIRAAVTLQMRIDPERDPVTIVIRTAKMLGFALNTQHITRDLMDKIRVEIAALCTNSDDGDAPSTHQDQSNNEPMSQDAAVDGVQ